MNKKTRNKYIESKMTFIPFTFITYLSLLSCPQHYSTFTYLSIELKIYRHKYSFHASFYHLPNIFYPLISTQYYDVKLLFYIALYTIIDIYIYTYMYPETTSDGY